MVEGDASGHMWLKYTDHRIVEYHEVRRLRRGGGGWVQPNQTEGVSRKGELEREKEGYRERENECCAHGAWWLIYRAGRRETVT